MYLKPASLPSQITAGPAPAVLSLVSQANLQGVVSGVRQQGGESLLDTRHLDSSQPIGPLYWRLPPQYQGHQVQLHRVGLVYCVLLHVHNST